MEPRSHRLGLAHLLVAATAQELSPELVTSNVRDYPMFANLRAQYD